MTLIGLSSVEKSYGGRTVLRGLGMKVNAGARIGLVGGNGAGKSTVLRILAGTEDVDGGEVIRRRGSSVATLPQHIEGDERTPMEVVRAARPEISDLQEELAGLRGAARLARGGGRPAPDAAGAGAPGPAVAPLHGARWTRLRGRGTRLPQVAGSW